MHFDGFVSGDWPMYLGPGMSQPGVYSLHKQRDMCFSKGLVRERVCRKFRLFGPSKGMISNNTFLDAYRSFIFKLK